MCERAEAKAEIRSRHKISGGVTLLTLVITIVVLLILASTTIATLTGDNGIITKAGEASEQAKIAGYKESIQLSVQYLVMDGSIFGDVDYPEKLEAEMQNYSNLEGAKAQAWGEDAVKVTTKDGYVFWVRENDIAYAGTAEEVGDKMPPPAGWEAEKGTGKEPGGNGVEEGKDVGTTNPEDPSNPDYWVDPENPGEGVEPEDVYPVYKKEIRVTRYIYKNKRMEDIIGYMYTAGDVKDAKPAVVELGTDEETSEINGHQVTPYKWVRDLKKLNTVSDIRDLEGIEPNNTVELSSNATYYMVYEYLDDFNYIDPSTGKTETAHQKGYIGSDGETERTEKRDSLPEVTPKEEWGGNWEVEKGTGKDTDPDQPGIQGGGNGIEEGHDVWTTNPSDPSDKDSWVDPKDEDTGIDKEIAPVFKQKVIATRIIYENQKIEDVEGYMYRSYSDDTVKVAKINLGTDDKTKKIGDADVEAYKWVTDLNKITETEDIESLEGIPVNTEVEQEVEKQDYYMVYKYTRNVKYIDPSDGQEKDGTEEGIIGSDGETKKEDPNKPKLPDPETNKPEGWEVQKGDGKGTEEDTDPSQPGVQGGTGIPEGKDVWTTNPDDPSDKESWIDPSDPKTELDPSTPVSPVYKKEVTATRHLYGESGERTDTLKGYVYRSAKEGTEKPAKINLGTDEQTTKIGEYDVEPYKWVLDLSVITETEDIESLDGTPINEEVEQMADTEDYYMVYKYTRNVKYIDPSDGQEKDGTEEGIIGSDGKTKKEDENNKLPDPNTNKPQGGWEVEKGTGKDTDPEEPGIQGGGNGVEEGHDVWTTNPDNPEDKDSWVDPSDPNTKLPEDTPVSPVYKLKVVAHTYTYENEKKDIEAYKYRSAKEGTEKPAKINLGTDAITSEINGHKVSPFKWVEDLNILQTMTSEENIQGIEPNEPVEQTEEEKDYYMIYKYTENYKYIDQNDGQEKDGTVEGYIGSDGSEKELRNKIPEIEVPGDLAEQGWETEKGTGKDTDPDQPGIQGGGNGIEEGHDVWTTNPDNPEDKESWIDPTDPNTELDPSTPVSPVYSKTVSIIYNKSEDYGTEEQGMPDKQSQEIYTSAKKGVVVKKASMTIAKNTPTREKYDFIEWNDKKTLDGTKYTPEQSVELENDLNLYAVWKISDAEPPTITFTPDGKGQYGKSYSVSVTVNDNEEVDTGSLKYKWIQRADNSKELEEGEYTGENSGSFTELTKSLNTPDGVTGNDWYLWIYAKDVNDNDISKSSGAFFLDNRPPEAFTPDEITEKTSKSVTVTGRTEDKNSGIKKYEFSITEEESPQDLNALDWKQNEPGKETQESYTFNDLKAGTKYYVRMRATDNLDYSTISSPVNVTTDEIPGLEKDSTIIYGYEPPTWTPDPVTVSLTLAGEQAEAEKNGYELLYSFTNTENYQDWTKYNSTPFQVQDNFKTIYTRLGDGKNLGGYAEDQVKIIDKLPPNALETPSATVTTNSMTIEGTATTDNKGDETSGFSDIEGYYFDIDNKDDWKTNDSNKKQTSYTFSGLTQGTEHTIRMKARDNAGNETDPVSVTKTLDNVPGGEDKNPDNPSESIITFQMKVNGEVWAAKKGDGKNWTNQDVTVEVKHTAGENYVLETSKTGVGDWQPYSTGILMQQNGTIYARLKEKNGSQTSKVNATFTLDLIDKKLPDLEKPTLTPTTNSIKATVKAVTDIGETGTTDASGIEGYYFKLEKKAGTGNTEVQGWTKSTSLTSPECTFTEGVEQNQTYIVSVKVKDNAGNETQTPVTEEKSTPEIPGGETLKAKLSFTAKIGDTVWNQDTWKNAAGISAGLKVEVTLNDAQLSNTFELQTKSTEDDNWKTYPTGGVAMTGNGTVSARLKENNGTQTGVETTFEITHVDKKAPTALQNNLKATTKTTNSVVVTGTATTDATQDATSGQSNGIKYLFAKDSEGSWAEESSPTHTFTGLTAGQGYTFKMKAKDAAGNETAAVELQESANAIPGGSSAKVLTFKKYKAKDATGSTFNDAEWDEQWTNLKVKVTVAYSKPEGGQDFDIQYSTEATPDKDNSNHWKPYTSAGIVVDGNTSIHARLKEKDGNQYGNYETIKIEKIDTLAPNDITNMSYSSDSNSITVTGSTTDQEDNGTSGMSDINHYEYRIDSSSGTGTWQTSKQTSYTFGPYTTGSLTAGTSYTVKMKAVDNAGNYIEASKTASTTEVGGGATISATYKTRDPNNSNATESTYSTSSWTNQDVIIRLSASNLDTKKYKIQWASGSSPSSSAWKDYVDTAKTADTGLPVLTANGTIKARLKEVNGNQTGASATYTITTIDKKAPTISTNTPTAAESVTLTVSSASDESGGSGINQSTYQFYKRIGTSTSSVQGPNSTKSYSYSLVVDQPTVIYAQVKDNAGNVGKSTEITLTRLYTFTDENPEALSTAIDKTTYGNEVPKYTTGYDTWRIFYKDSKNTFLITDKTATRTNLKSPHSTTTISEVANKLNPTWSGCWETSSTGNKGALFLLQPSSWTTYKASDAAYAIGGPSLDLYIKSWNATQGTSYTLSRVNFGLNVNTRPSSTSGKCNNIYYGGSFQTTGNLGDNWWLSTPGGMDIVWCAINGGIGNGSPTSTNGGVRPVVCIPTSVFNARYK